MKVFFSGLHYKSGNWVSFGSMECDEQDFLNAVSGPLRDGSGYIRFGRYIIYPENFSSFVWNVEE